MKTESELVKEVEDLKKQLDASVQIATKQAEELKLKDLQIESKSEQTVFEFGGQKMQFLCKMISHQGIILETEEIVKNIDNYSELLEKMKDSRYIKII